MSKQSYPALIPWGCQRDVSTDGLRKVCLPGRVGDVIQRHKVSEWPFCVISITMRWISCETRGAVVVRDARGSPYLPPPLYHPHRIREALDLSQVPRGRFMRFNFREEGKRDQ